MRGSATESATRTSSPASASAFSRVRFHALTMAREVASATQNMLGTFQNVVLAGLDEHWSHGATQTGRDTEVREAATIALATSQRTHAGVRCVQARRCRRHIDRASNGISMKSNPVSAACSIAWLPLSVVHSPTQTKACAPNRSIVSNPLCVARAEAPAAWSSSSGAHAKRHDVPRIYVVTGARIPARDRGGGSRAGCACSASGLGGRTVAYRATPTSVAAEEAEGAIVGSKRELPRATRHAGFSGERLRGHRRGARELAAPSAARAGYDARCQDLAAGPPIIAPPRGERHAHVSAAHGRGR